MRAFTGLIRIMVGLVVPVGVAGLTLGLDVALAQPKVPPKTVAALVLRDHADATSPDAGVWKRAPVARVPLQPAFQAHPAIVGAPSVVALSVQAIRTPENLYVRVAWDDPTADTSVNGMGQFLDGAAIQFPLNGVPDTPPFMGDPQNRVNIWHWRADGHPETLVAAGFGTATLASSQDVRALGQRTARGWAVVIARRLLPESDEGVRLDRVRRIPIAFAVWNGSNQERDGFKAVTLEWWSLRF
jgi:dimethylsulfide dehydrogenase subunit gamma/complex iron-sulfur molybdoenzyme family reductase subunit gamma